MPVFVRSSKLNLLATRAGYNMALRHFRVTQDMASGIAEGYNLADLFREALKEERVSESQILPVVNLLLVGKYGYAYRSENLTFQVDSIDKLSKTVNGWTNIQVVFVRTDNNGGIHILNPESPDEWKELLPFPVDTHLVCYVGSLEKVDDVQLKNAESDVFTLLSNGRVKSNPAYKSSKSLKCFLDGTEETEQPAVSRAVESTSAAPPPVPGGARKKLTPKVGVNVTNELFHNGNVESWKRIIESYRVKYPQLDVLIWYEGERINDINALFKWGKVKHGVPIMFSVAGDNPAEISKLKKYLFEGASPRFEAFLHGGPGNVLKLF